MGSKLHDFLRGKLAESDLATVDRLLASPEPSVVARLSQDKLVTFDSVCLDGDVERAADTTAEWSPSQDRYEDLGRIGLGAMGEVRRVRDRELNRVVAMKVLLPGTSVTPGALARFVEEAQATAQLQHPHIVPIYDMGSTRDGRLWFTMREIRGRNLGEVIEAVHRGGDVWTLRRLVAALLMVCQAVGYAHERGVIHRDLKPANIMLGEHGEVYVVDWGLAKVLGRPEAGGAGFEAIQTTGNFRTRLGAISGTPAYMAPEQARGEAVDARSDVYALGGTLHHLLTGDIAAEGTAEEVLEQTATGGLPALVSEDLPAELVAVCNRAMRFDPDARYPDARAMASDVEDWLDGARRKEQALQIVEAALGRATVRDEHLAESRRLDARADVLLADVLPSSAESTKLPAWVLQQRSRDLRRRAHTEDVELERGLYAALRVDPELAEAHAALSQRYRVEHAAAELARDLEAVTTLQSRLRDHSTALPSDHRIRHEIGDYLAGDGTLTLRTDPPGVEVVLFEYVEVNRRLVASSPRSLGTTPLDGVRLPMGSYLAVLSHPGRATVHYPVHLGRGDHWDGVRPGDREPLPIRLPLEGELGPDECYVPAGRFLAGGDPDAADSVARQHLWCDGFVMRRFPVTHREYIAFLDDLVRRGQTEHALALVPQETGGSDHEGIARYSLVKGRFRPQERGNQIKLDWPAFLIPIHHASEYAAWFAQRTGQPWALPAELAWEKAARGVDGRWFPWGDVLDPSWCNMRLSREGAPLPEVVDSFPVDVSVYGVRGMGGNVRDWCAEPFLTEGPGTVDGCVARPTPMVPGVAPPPGPRVARGGVWSGTERYSRCAFRWDYAHFDRWADLGFRLSRPL